MANNLLLYIIDTVSPNQEQYAISVPPNATVARAKAAFLRANAISGNHRVSFTFRAENLKDERPLLSYDIKRGDYLHRVVGPDDDVVGGYTFYMQLDRELHSANSQRRRGRGSGSPRSVSAIASRISFFSGTIFVVNVVVQSVLRCELGS